MIFHNVNDLKKISDEQKRRPSADQQWWLNLVHMQRIMSKYTDSEYTSESEERLEFIWQYHMTYIQDLYGWYSRSELRFHIFRNERKYPTFTRLHILLCPISVILTDFRLSKVSNPYICYIRFFILTTDNIWNDF